MAKRWQTRLSDFLFVSARYLATKEGTGDRIYQKPKGKE